MILKVILDFLAYDEYSGLVCVLFRSQLMELVCAVETDQNASLLCNVPIEV